jgi:hypothetical protein
MGRVLRTARMYNSSDFSLKYAPLLRLLESRQEDREFLQGHAGYCKDLGREYDSLRRTAILGYLRSLEKDWKQLYREALPYGLNDPQIAEMLAALDHELPKALRRIKFQLRLERWRAISKFRVEATAALLDQMSKIKRLSVASIPV